MFLPVLLATARHELGSGMRRIWEAVDEVISIHLFATIPAPQGNAGGESQEEFFPAT